MYFYSINFLDEKNIYKETREVFVFILYMLYTYVHRLYFNFNDMTAHRLIRSENGY